MRRALVLGWDGATWALAQPLLDRGELPNLQALMAAGSHGVLWSVVPPMTLPAWSSFLTGVGPGEHGILDFYRREGENLRPLTQRDRLVPTLPRRLSDAGLRVGTFLFPTTWPPEALSGGQISGFDSPVATVAPPSAFAPQALRSYAEQVIGRALHFADVDEFHKGVDWERGAARSLLRSIEEKERLALALVRDHGPYDLFAMLFGESDTGAHHLWHLWDRNSPRRRGGEGPEDADLLPSIYRRLDAALGRIVDAAPWDGVLIASDHGFGGTGRGVVHINAFLEARGWLCSTRGGALRSLRSRLVAALPPRVTETVARALPPAVLAEVERRSRLGAVDLDASTAFSDELGYAPSVVLRPRAGQSRTALASAVTRDLVRWTDDAGRPVVAKVVPREEAVPGPACAFAPDLFLELNCPAGYAWNVLPTRRGDPPLSELPTTATGAKGTGMPGSHRPDGLYVATGLGARGERARSIVDVLPWWLRGLGFDLGDSRAVAAPSASDVGDPASLYERLRALGYVAGR